MYRFRLRQEGALLVLQVADADALYGGKLTWRDATVQDIPVRDPFDRDPQAVFGIPAGATPHPTMPGIYNVP